MSAGKLTATQARVLRTVADNRGAAHAAYALGRQTCEALRVRGLVSTRNCDCMAITKSWNPYIYITEAGRIALAQGQDNG